MEELTLNTYFNKIKNLYKAILKIKESFDDEKPIILCLGSKHFSADMLGPLTGELLKKKYNVNTYVYGCLSYPIANSNYDYVIEFLNLFHKDKPILVVDACIGENEELGQIKIINGGIKPGLAVDKDIKEIGKLSIVGITIDKSFTYKQLMFKTKLDIIYKMANFIAFSIAKAIGTKEKEVKQVV